MCFFELFYYLFSLGRRYFLFLKRLTNPTKMNDQLKKISEIIGIVTGVLGGIIALYTALDTLSSFDLRKLVIVIGAVAILYLLYVQRAKKEGEEGNTYIYSSKARKVAFFGMITLFLLITIAMVYPLFNSTEVNEANTCQSFNDKTAIYVAKFEGDDLAAFTISLEGQLKRRLGAEKYSHQSVDHLNLREGNYRDSVWIKHFKTNCDTIGLFVNGLRKVGVGKEKAFNAKLDLINLKFIVHQIKDEETITLNNPKAFKFDINEDAIYLAKYINALFKALEGNTFASLKILHEIERDSSITLDEEFLAATSMLKGHNYAMRGNKALAIQAYQKAKDNGGVDLKKVVNANLELVPKIEAIYNSTPEYRKVLEENIKKDTLLIGSNTKSTITIEKQDTTVLKEIAEQLDEIAMDSEKKDTKSEDNEEQVKSGLDLTSKGGIDTTNQNVENDEFEDNIEESNPTTEEKPKAELSLITKKTENSFTTNDGVTYSFKRMKDDKIWMTQNLNLEVSDSWCYGNDKNNCAKYGRLYTWEAAKKACEQIGEGWRLPTDEEWKEMTKQYGGFDNSTEAYENFVEGGISGFSTQLGGYGLSDDEYFSLGTYGSYWSSTVDNGGRASFFSFDSDGGELYLSPGLKTDARSVRCIKDSPIAGEASNRN